MARVGGRTTAGEIPSFDAPPVVEVVLSVWFEPIAGLRSMQLARLWEDFREAFPNVEEQPAYPMQVESFGKPTAPSVSLELLQKAPVPRLWFIDQAGAQLVQIQDNWFARNWRKAPGALDYPRYPKLSKAFVEDLNVFRQYLQGEALGDLQFSQCEVTYVNHIEVPDPSKVGNLGSVLTLVANSKPSFNAPPEAQQLNSQYVIGHNGGPVGRLHVSANGARRVIDGADIIVLNLTARGVPLGKDVGGVVAFQDLGREWAIRAFVGLTRPRMHEKWRIRR